MTPLSHFNPRTPVGCDHRPIKGAGLLSGISIHAPQWGATLVRVEMATYRTISIHAPQWGATNRARHGAGQPVISIHAPQWGATCRTATVWSPGRYFNPRTPVGCDLVAVWDIGVIVGISIHAPQWGATSKFGQFLRKYDEFQSTHPSGVRLFDDQVVVRGVGIISIHAPQWGATTPFTVTRLALIFQSTHPSGVRPVTGTSVISLVRFQSTHPSGVRQLTSVTISSVAEFQSTHPSGVRLSCGLPT